MKAFIFNSGTGSRMEELTVNIPKALVKLSNGETLLGRQIRLLQNAGVTEVVISTGPFEKKIMDLTKSFKNIKFKFINNPIYDKTNSIYSLYLSKDFVKDNFIVLHGDLVFDSSIVEKLINSNDKDLCLISTTEKLPDKDFKGKIINGNLTKISVDIFGEDCFALQPMYKFSKNTMIKWLNEIENFVKRNDVNVYAENALNNILNDLEVKFIDYKDSYIGEIDNKEDLEMVSNEFRLFDYRNQKIINTNNYIKEIKKYVFNNKLKKPLVVHGKRLLKDEDFNRLLKEINGVSFCEYTPNPKYEEAIEGLKIFKENSCDGIVSIGGGSCIDTAKAIKLYSGMNDDVEYINQSPTYVDLPLLAIPTTAGTGTESTRYAVIYYNNEKQSVVHDCILPDLCILDESFLYTLPEYHKKSALLDAFCQAIESYWSVNSNNTSKKYSYNSINLILNNYESYLNNDKKVYSNIMNASNLAGKAINITQTTAPHAMSYKVTTLTGVAHGHAVAILLPEVLEYMLQNIDLNQDKRGKDYLTRTFYELSEMFGIDDVKILPSKIKNIVNDFGLSVPEVKQPDIKVLVESVNSTRLKNSPIKINSNAVKHIYKNSFKLNV